MKRILSTVLAIAMILSTMGMTTFAAETTGVTTYEALKTALEAGGNVVLGADIEVTTQIDILVGVSATLDLNGFNITSGYQTSNPADSDNPKHIYPFGVYGELTVTCSAGTGSISGRGIYVYDGSKLTVNSGSIYGVDANGGSAIFMYGGELDINGGHIEQKAEGTTNFAVNALAGKVTVDGGWIGGNHGAIASEASEVVLNDGTFVCTGTVGMTDNVLYTYSTGSIAVNGGTFIADGDSAGGGCCVYDANGGIVVNDGNFSNSSGGDVWGTTGTTINGGTFENLTETSHVTVGSTIVNGGTTYTMTENGLEEGAPEVTYVTEVDGVKYTDIQEAIKAAAPSGTVELLADVTVDEWIMFAETMSIGNGKLNTLNINGLTINGNDHTLTINSVESAGNGGYLFFDATKLNIKDLTIDYPNNGGGIGLKSGTISNVTINGGNGIYPGDGEININGCTFNTTGCAIYNEKERDELVVAGNTFNVRTEDGYAIYIRGNTTFTNNEVTSGKVNVTSSATGTISGNNFNNERFKVYNEATATITNNVINNLVFSDKTTTQSTFSKNTMSEAAQAALDAVQAPESLSGTGTEADPYLINNLDELIWFRDKVDEQASDGSTQFAGKYFKLTSNIDLAGIDWNPIGSMSGDHGSFKGVFDGNGKTISNLTISSFNEDGAGLFARTAGNAEIKNLTLNNVTISSAKNYVGGVVANSYASTKITNVHVTGNVNISGRGYIGGISGHGYVVMDTVSVKANEGSIVTSSFWCCGGILGYGGEGATDIKSAYVENLTVTSAAGGLGAIVGMAEDNNGTQPISGSNLSAKNVDIKTYVGAYGTNYEDYAMGYLYGGNPTSELTGTLNVEDVTVVTASGKPASVNDAVAQIGNSIYFNLAEALIAAKDGDTVKLIANEDKVVDMNGSVYGKTVTITGTATVDWSKGFLFVGRGGEGDGALIFDNANLTSASNQASTGIHVSGREKNTTNKYDGTLIIKNSTIELDYLINKGTMTLDNSTLTVKNGFSVGGRPASETESGKDATATLTLNNGSKVIVNNHNGMGLGYEAVGVMNIDTTSAFETTQSFLVTEKGTMNIKGTAKIAGTLTNNGVIKLADANATLISNECGNVSAWDNGYVVVYENGIYGVVEKTSAPALPTATVTKITNDNLTFALNFKADEVTDEQLAYYGDWYADYVLTVNKDVTFNANGNADGYLSGQYDGFGENWLNVPFEDVTLNANEPLKIMEYAAKLMQQPGLKLTYRAVYTDVQDFDCGVFFDEEFLAANPDLKVTLELRMYNPEDETQSYVIGETYTYTAKDIEEEDPHAAGKLALSKVYTRENMGLTDTGKFQIGLYAGIDSLDYKEVGFDIYEVGENNALTKLITYDTEKVYKKLTSKNLTVTAEELKVEQIFGCILELGSRFENKPIVYEAYALCSDGVTRITGGKFVVTVKE